MVAENWSTPETGADRESREQLVRDWRRQARAIYMQQRALAVVDIAVGTLPMVRWIEDVLEFLREQHADTEFALAVDLRDRGPIELDGRRYEHWLEESTGCHRVGVRPAETPAEAIGVATEMNGVEEVP